MRFLESPPPFLFFTGKGGVGKTSLACAAAVELADAGKRVLLVSTDPASNVAQVLGITIGNHMTPVTDVPGLTALEIDPQEAVAQYRDRIVGPVRGVLPDDVVRGIEEQLSGACTTEIAAFDEFTALLTDPRIHAEYDHILFDTAPTGHTIRLLQLPGAWSGFIEANPEGASCLGPLSGLEKQQAQYQSAVEALADDQRTRLVLVARAQRSALQEVVRTQGELDAIGIRRQHLVINGVLPAEEVATDPLAAALHAREQAAMGGMPPALTDLPTDIVPLKPFNLVGLSMLRALLRGKPDEGVDAAELPELPELPELNAPTLSTLVDALVEADHGLIMVMGKGGVGKTTLAAAVAVALADRGFPVHLTTSDPAAHLVETLGGEVEQLTVSRIDPQAETERYQRDVLATKGKDLDERGRALLEEDLRSPCTEEIAVFQAFSRIIREAGKHFVVMDTAPTGHTLLLLDATGAYHKEVARQLGAKNLKFTTPMMQLQDPERTRVLLATLAETTPVLEAAELQADLQRAGIKPWAWIVNNSLAAARPHSLLLRQRARQEIERIDEVATTHAPRYAVVPLLAEEPVGAENLRALTKST